ncbi:CBS domain-containing protein [Psychromonas marina]|uniref:CBS domain-containing protein n=1 Tax=Psychromonas marina TaxID=88364 RepID=A0ABQ6DYS6_9GAMM|nr:CBS domain-containing protein [Psychromonas marina]GLS90304.1 CBS domain-containing protein [Psychromonas marina]
MNNLDVSHYMIGKSLSFRKEMAIQTAVEILLENDQIGGPVIDDAGRVIGWLSEQDCLAKMLEASYHCELVALVEDAMVSPAVTIKKEMSVVDVAQLMLDAKPKIYPVVDSGDHYIGLISRKKVLGAMNKQIASC